jgi:hypothetical protein
MNIEQIRRDVTLLGKAVDNHDELVNNITESRWRHDMIVEMPELGRARHPGTGETVIISPAEMRENIAELEQQREAAERVAARLTGAENMDGARAVYLNVLTAYQRVGSLRELARMVELDYKNAREEMEKLGFETRACLSAAIQKAEERLATDAQTLNMGVSVIERPSSGILLPS